MKEKNCQFPTQCQIRQVFVTSFPVMMGYIPLGIAFGYLLQTQTGASWVYALLMSVFVYAGTAQFLAVPLLAVGMPVSAIVFTTFIVNLRHMFYGLSLLDKMPKNFWAKTYLVFSLTDETYSLLMSQKETPSTQFSVMLAMLNQSWWVIGSLLGALLGSHLPFKLDGIEFCLVALFVVLAIEQAFSVKRIEPFVTALVAFPLALLFVPQQSLLVSILISLVIGFFLFARTTGEIHLNNKTKPNKSNQ